MNFALAEEVTLKGGHERRPDLVLYLNGLAYYKATAAFVRAFSEITQNLVKAGYRRHQPITLK